MYRLVRNLYLLAFMMIIIFVSGWFYNYHVTSRRLLETAEKSTELAVYSRSEKISGWLAKKNRTIEAAGYFLSLGKWSDEEALAYLETLLKNNPNFESIYFGTSDNQMLNASGWVPPEDFDLQKRPWYIKALAENQTTFTEAFTNANNEKIIFTIAAPVYDSNNELLGVIAGDVAVEQIISLVNEVSGSNNLEDEAYSFLIDTEGHIIAHPEMDYVPGSRLITFDEHYSHLAEDFAALTAENSRTSQVILADEEGYLAQLQIPGTRWRLASFTPLGVFTAGSDRLTAEFLTALTAALLISMVFVLYHHTYTHKPLLRLESHLHKIDVEKNLDYRVPIENNNDLAVLINTINGLLDKAQTYFNNLEESKSELKKTNRELEDLISKLTTAEEALDYSEEKLYYLSYHDQLTGLYNRFFFEARLKQLENKAEYPLTVISTDIDGLKLLNDTLGHTAGDRLLKTCANILNENLGHSGILARVGGDEFSAILPLTGKEESECLARQIRYRLTHYNQHNPDLPLSISMGIATAEKSGTTLKKVFKEAEDEMCKDKLHRTNSARNGIVQSLMMALAERDYISQGHVQRLDNICQAVGEKINLHSAQLANLALLAQVHDLGKVGIPDQVLFKPGPLSEDEWAAMKQHSEKGYRIASTSCCLEKVADLILKHHERWDGSGYPLGLQGKEIPIECRILSIAEAYDVMTSHRPYQNAAPKEKAIAEIRKQAGSQFDPELVRIFIATISGD